MAEYSRDEIHRIEARWRQRWEEKGAYKTVIDPSRPKCYVLDMFPYPSGAGLHVGHPLGYIASDIYARYKRLKGFNVLHPMGFDAFGLPAEQYAIDHGIHPAKSTADNIQTFKRQLNQIGFSYDWSREVQTCDPAYYRWTQWIFLQIFDSWYNRKKEKAERVSELIRIFETEGNQSHPVPNSKFPIQSFDHRRWKGYSEKEKQDILMQYRLAYLAYTDVNWCEALGTVLANDEVINGVSYRGGHPVVKRQMRQWSLRITEYAERLLKGLDEIDFSESMKEIQRNWIGRSIGAEVEFGLIPGPSPGEKGAGLIPGPSPEEKGGASVRDHVYTADSKMWSTLKERAGEMRKQPTEAEELLWRRLRNSALGVKFRRQHAISTFIADFVCIPAKLVVEVDGPIHDQQKRADEERTKALKAEGFRVLRFKNDEVLANINTVLQKIEDSVSPSPPERGPGGEAGTEAIKVFTTRVDTLFGVTFMVLAPEHELVEKITTPDRNQEVDDYVAVARNRPERERMSEVKRVSGVFTGAYAKHPFTGAPLPVWIADYVLAGYGTGAVMAVPGHDERDHRFAKHFGLPIVQVVAGPDVQEQSFDSWDSTIINSAFMNGLTVQQAIEAGTQRLEELGIGKGTVTYKMRDAGWSRQRYWGEPFPVFFRDDTPYAMKESELPLELPPSNNFKPSGTGEGPLANLKEWIQFTPGLMRDSNTMPTHAGAAWYFLRFMDPHNKESFADRKTLDYWNQVDVYIGGSEHAVAHLLYSRLWVKILHDLGYLNFDEPFKKLINQGKITGDSRFVYRVEASDTRGGQLPYPIFVSAGIKTQLSPAQLLERCKTIEPGTASVASITEMHVDVKLVDGLELNTEAFRKWKPDFASAEFILEEDGKYLCGSAIEKMSKSYFNVVNPDDIVQNYGADTLRLYEMFLGPLEQSKPWSTQGIDGVFKFLRRFWNLFHDTGGNWSVSDAEPTRDELKILHRTIRKVSQDVENFSFNTCVSEFMICANELSALKCNKRAVLEPLVIALAPFAPHLAEELWEKLGNEGFVVASSFPGYDEAYLKEADFEYPVSINGKVRAKMVLPLDLAVPEIEKRVLEAEAVQKWTSGKAPKKVIVVPGKIVNVVL
jgi:leucyl-tRNA synthetase